MLVGKRQSLLTMRRYVSSSPARTSSLVQKEFCARDPATTYVIRVWKSLLGPAGLETRGGLQPGWVGKWGFGQFPECACNVCMRAYFWSSQSLRGGRAGDKRGLGQVYLLTKMPGAAAHSGARSSVCKILSPVIPCYHDLGSQVSCVSGSQVLNLTRTKNR